jgi:hypothetical protein
MEQTVRSLGKCGKLVWSWEYKDDISEISLQRIVHVVGRSLQTLVGTQRLQLKVSLIRRNGQDAKRIRVSKASFPTLHGDDRGTALDDL